MWTSHIGRTRAELEASTFFRREFTDKENLGRRNLLVMARLARAPHCGSIKPLSASPRAVLSEGERARVSHPVYKSSVEPGSAPRSRKSGIFIKMTSRHLLSPLSSSRVYQMGPPGKLRIAVYGGSFDPITNAHLTCVAEIGGLEQSLAWQVAG